MHFPCSITSYLIKYVKKRTLKILHLNGISANFCCFIIGDLSPLLPEPVTNNGISGAFHSKKSISIGGADYSYIGTAVLSDSDDQNLLRCAALLFVMNVSSNDVINK